MISSSEQFTDAGAAVVRRSEVLSGRLDVVVTEKLMLKADVIWTV